jgi:phenylacetate-coenzyme A ligase PaaK-like adenylate-forming protein
MRTLFDLRPEFLSTYPSTARNLAIVLHRRGRTYPRLRLLHLTSEMLDGRTRRLLAEAFPVARIVESYASTEGGLIATTCREGRWHVAEDRCLVEIDENSEAIVTDLTNWSTPILRYRGLGDVCRWEDGACPCGSRRRSIRLVEGRITDSILLPDGTALSPYQVTNAIDDVAGVYQYQVAQVSADRIEVRVVKTAAGREATIRDAARRSLSTVVPTTVSIDVRFAETIAPRGRHKVPLVVSDIGGVP